jgi:hypothetical protein
MAGTRVHFFLIAVVIVVVGNIRAEERPPWMIGIYADYSATSEYVPSGGRIIDSFRTDADAGTPGLGLSATCMVKDWFGIGGEIMGQVYHWTSHTYGFDIGPIYWPKPDAAADYSEGPSGTDIRFNFLFRTMLIPKPFHKTQWAFLLGIGAYGYSRSEMGVHGGILIRRILPNKNAVFFGSRVHLIPVAGEIGALVQLVAGIEFRVESKRP